MAERINGQPGAEREAIWEANQGTGKVVVAEFGHEALISGKNPLGTAAGCRGTFLNFKDEKNGDVKKSQRKKKGTCFVE